VPTNHSPELDHKPLDLSKDLECIATHVDNCRPQVLEIMERCGSPLAEEEQEYFFRKLTYTLTGFALKANALPKRTANQLKATIRAISKDPVQFLEKSEKFDPEAVARVLGVCARRNRANNQLLMTWELGRGKGPPPEEIKKAAQEVLFALPQDKDVHSSKGRPRQSEQGDLAISLSKAFLAHGGKITRNVGRKDNQETGEFHRFLELLLPAVNRIATRAGITLTVTTMVAKAQKVLKPTKLASTRAYPINHIT
jgi:hypothetical protein